MGEILHHVVDSPNPSAEPTFPIWPSRGSTADHCTINDENLLAPPRHRFRFLTREELHDITEVFGSTTPYLGISKLEFEGKNIALIRLGIYSLHWRSEKAFVRGCGGSIQFEKVKTEWRFRSWGFRLCY